MGETLLKEQNQVGTQYRMPTQDQNSSIVQQVTAEALSFFYFLAGVPTANSGAQAAGTVIFAKLQYDKVLDAGGVQVGMVRDTSFAFGTGTMLISANQKRFDRKKAERDGNGSLESIAIAVTESFGNGDWCLDHENGVIYGKKATTGTTDTASYKIRTASLGSGGGTPGSSTTTVTNQLKRFQDTSFVTGDSPATLDVNAAMGRNSADSILYNYGAGDITVEVSTNGTTFESSFILPAGTTLSLEGYSLDTMRLSWIADTKYLLIAR